MLEACPPVQCLFFVLFFGLLERVIGDEVFSVMAHWTHFTCFERGFVSPPRYSILVNLPVFERFKSQEWDGKLGRRKSCKVQVQPKGASQPPNRMHERLHADKARSCVWSALRTAVGRATTVRRPCLVGEQRHAQRRLPKDILGVGGDEHHATSASAVCRIGRGLGALAWRGVCFVNKQRWCRTYCRS